MPMPQFNIYTDGSCLGNPGPGGWAAIVLKGSTKQVISGKDPSTTNNRMEIFAIIKGLEAIPENSVVSVFSDSLYVVNTMTKNWKRKANQDLWAVLDGLVNSRTVTWQWIKGHSGHPYNEEADSEARKQIKQRGKDLLDSSEISYPKSASGGALTHLDERGHARMVDVGGKSETKREAVARGFVSMNSNTLQLITEGLVKKGDVLTVARLAGIMGAKQTSSLIPLCHPIAINQVTVELEPDTKSSGITITSTVSTEAKTGVEMEALTAVAITALTIYDMCKSHDRAMRVEAIRLVRKLGGKSGDFVLEE